jgi:hypothetical protein
VCFQWICFHTVISTAGIENCWHQNL